MKVYNTGKLVQVDFEITALTGDEIVATLRTRIDQVLEVLPQPNVVLNFANVEHISSAFLGELMLTQMKVTGQGGQLCLAHLNKNVRESLTIAGVAGNFRFFDTVRAAVKSFK